MTAFARGLASWLLQLAKNVGLAFLVFGLPPAVAGVAYAMGV